MRTTVLVVLLLTSTAVPTFADVHLPERPRVSSVSKTLHYSEDLENQFKEAVQELAGRLARSGCVKATASAWQENENIVIALECVEYQEK